MLTLLCECESIVNGRPLTYIYDDPNELKAIKPSDFIQDIKGTEVLDLDIVDAKHLQLSSSEIFEDVPAIVKSAPDTSSSAKQCSTSNDQSFQSEDLPKEQEETLKKTRLGRQIVPPKRLDL
ncbi:uncharacterized protein NPIL_45821 [Nephila pilipes]|uniref:Uncharacterized protein n=1 Tax=Nephila pilipes TaxID=299642 RepID=A0A8X6UVM6_NEPPI|nr:uncharacterized protein NPIL_45821 [Nephila pilipes]